MVTVKRRRKKRRRRYGGSLAVEARDGLEINTVNENDDVCKSGLNFTLYDRDNVHVKENGWYKRVGIMKNNANLNRLKTYFINSHKDFVRTRR